MTRARKHLHSNIKHAHTLMGHFYNLFEEKNTAILEYNMVDHIALCATLQRFANSQFYA